MCVVARYNCMKLKLKCKHLPEIILELSKVILSNMLIISLLENCKDGNCFYDVHFRILVYQATTFPKLWHRERFVGIEEPKWNPAGTISCKYFLLISFIIINHYSLVLQN